MQIRNVNIGDKWGTVEVLDKGIVDEESGLYEPGMEYRQVYIDLQCSCGTLFRHVSSTWEGKRKTMDCGCGAYNPDIMQAVSVTISISLLNYRQLKYESKHRNISFNKLIREIIKEHEDKQNRG